MSVRLLLGSSGEKLITCRPEDTVETIASILSQNRIGALPVRDAAGRLVGIISERDIVRGLAQSRAGVLDLRVADLMTRDVVVCQPEDTVRSLMEKMARRTIRHLPVVEGGLVVGILSQRDIMRYMMEQTQLEANVLRDYVVAKR